MLSTANVEGFFINQKHWQDNYVYLPPIEVSFDYPFLNAITAIQPSPDWFTGFYLFNTVDEYDRTFWQRFTLRTYPWDAGTDNGQYYTAPDQDTDPPLPVSRILVGNAPENGAFLNKDGTDVPPVAEWDCELWVCPVDNPFCQRPRWPPSNYCDILKYPLCNSYCDPNVTISSTGEELMCQECRGNGFEPRIVHFEDCCAAGHDPLHGPNCEILAAKASGALSTFSSSVVMAFSIALGTSTVWNLLA